jgi:hypothetical protein
MAIESLAREESSGVLEKDRVYSSGFLLERGADYHILEENRLLPSNLKWFINQLEEKGYFESLLNIYRHKPNGHEPYWIGEGTAFLKSIGLQVNSVDQLASYFSGDLEEVDRLKSLGVLAAKVSSIDDMAYKLTGGLEELKRSASEGIIVLKEGQNPEDVYNSLKIELAKIPPSLEFCISSAIGENGNGIKNRHSFKIPLHEDYSPVFIAAWDKSFGYLYHSPQGYYDGEGIKRSIKFPISFIFEKATNSQSNNL